MSHDDYDPDPDYDCTTYYCTACKKECVVYVVDEGIGAYEYWGAKGVDVRLVPYSSCCDAEVTEEAPEEDEDE